MPTQSSPSDPRNFWRWRHRLALIPGAVSLLSALAGVFLRFTWFFWRNRLPSHRGICIVSGEINGDLYEARAVAALDVLHEHATVYLRWLQRSFRVLFVDQTMYRLKASVGLGSWDKVLFVNPKLAWKSSPEQLALDLVIEATRGRTGKRFRRSRGARI